MTVRYVRAVLRRRPAETLGSVLAVALAVALLASLGAFTSQASRRLTSTAAARVPVDWQLQLTAQGDPARLPAALAQVPGVTGAREVDYARVPGLQSTGPTGTRTTGTAYVVSLPADYAAFAPGELRALLGAQSGVALQQQTAANLSAAAGSRVTVLGSRATVTVDRVVDLPLADSFFQVVGASPTAGAAAPPDNVLLVPPDRFHALVGTAPVVRQWHVRLDHAGLPPDPATAADAVAQRANRLLVSLAGGALVGDNLEASLSAAREDALYARLLVLLLGLPGLVLAAVVAALVISLRTQRQRRDLEVLRLRGATPAAAARLLGAVAIADGLLGALVGCIAAGSGLTGAGRAPGLWLAVGAAAGVVLALVVELAPLRRQPRAADDDPLALRLWLDAVLLGAGAVVWWLAARSGYQVVVVPEGVPVTSVNYGALLAPALAWPGAALLVWRLTRLVVRNLPVPEGGRGLTDMRRLVLRRRASGLARGSTAVAIALAITTSCAIFTATYDRQARVDVALTVGSDVAVTLPPDSPASLSPSIARGHDVRAVEQVAHRLAYVGSDLQDLYGVDAARVGRAAPLQDAFTPGSSIGAALRRLASTPDGVLLSQETLHDYQLHPGDLIRLRLRDRTGAYRPVSFHVVGVVTEFATAPRDSFIIANRAYVAHATGRGSVQTLLVRTDHPAAVAARIHAPALATVASTTSATSAVTSASGLAAGSLGGLSRILLGFGLVLAAASCALVLASGALARRPALTALALLGADTRQRGSFLWSEARALLAAGLLGGVAVGLLLAQLLVKVLTGIFDPPPQHIAVPVGLVLATFAGVVVSAVLATLLLERITSRVDPADLRS